MTAVSKIIVFQVLPEDNRLFTDFLEESKKAAYLMDLDWDVAGPDKLNELAADPEIWPIVPWSDPHAIPNRQLLFTREQNGLPLGTFGNASSLKSRPNHDPAKGDLNEGHYRLTEGYPYAYRHFQRGRDLTYTTALSTFHRQDGQYVLFAPPTDDAARFHGWESGDAWLRQKTGQLGIAYEDAKVSYHPILKRPDSIDSKQAFADNAVSAFVTLQSATVYDAVKLGIRYDADPRHSPPGFWENAGPEGDRLAMLQCIAAHDIPKAHIADVLIGSLLRANRG
jgi:hypothetical protein